MKRTLTLTLGVIAIALASCSTSSGPLEITAVDYSYEGLPSTVAAGTEIVLMNR